METSLALAVQHPRIVLWWKLKLLDSDLSLTTRTVKSLNLQNFNSVSCSFDRTYFQTLPTSPNTTKWYKMPLQTPNTTKCHGQLRFLKTFLRRQLAPVQPFFSQSAVSTLEKQPGIAGLDILWSTTENRKNTWTKNHRWNNGEHIRNKKRKTTSNYLCIIQYHTSYIGLWWSMYTYAYYQVWSTAWRFPIHGCTPSYHLILLGFSMK